jgi:hypothetical protein
MSSDDHDDDDLVETTLTTGIEVELDPKAEIGAVIDDLEALLKSGDVIGALTSKGVNGSIALLAVDGLRSYLAGDKASAAEDFATVAEEIRGRLAVAAEPPGRGEPTN